MKLKSLLIGSAAVMTVSTGAAKAADAIVMAEPEPMEYVRICDVYGTGFFYIPGTETCLAIGGYIRQQINFDNTGYNVLSRFDTTFDARTETEWGTLRGFANTRFNYQWGTRVANTGTAAAPVFGVATGYGTDMALPAAYIEIMTASGTLRLGLDDTPFTRFLGYEGVKQFNAINSTGFTAVYGGGAELSYTFNGSNGFSGIIALVDNPTTAGWGTNVEAGIRFAQGWGTVGLMAGYDPIAGTFGAVGLLHFKTGGIFSGSIQAFYTSGAGTYRVNAAQTSWSVLAVATIQATQTAAFNASAQWFDTGVWQFRGNVDWRPISGLRIRPEIAYTTATNTWGGTLRVQRDF
ncbi:MAG: porin [Brucellaceae bacterium]|nr:porin [Brucellaceae bacterium]